MSEDQTNNVAQPNARASGGAGGGSGKKRVYQTGQLDYAQKKAICLKKRAVPKITQEQLREWAKSEFALVKAPGQSTISDILKHADTILALDARALESKRVRSVTFPELDLALANWVLQCEARNVRVYNDLMKAQAGVFCALLGIAPTEMRFSGGWLESFKDRHGFGAFRAFGKAGKSGAVPAGGVAAASVKEAVALGLEPTGTVVADDLSDVIAGAVGGPDAAACSADGSGAAPAAHPLPASDSIQQIRERIASYSVQDVYAMQETGLFYRIESDASKKRKAKLTVALCTNADGSDRRDPLIIGVHKHPVSFRDKPADHYGLYYRSNKKSWMTGLLFRDWIAKFNVKMNANGRKVLLLLDRATSHVVTGLELSNVEVQFLPTNTATKLQPFDAGITRAFKLKYRALHLQHALEQAEEVQRWKHEEKTDRSSATPTNIYGISQLTAMRWILSTWKDVSDETILNCFQLHNLIAERIKTRQSVNQIERELEANVLYKMDYLRAHDPLVDSKVLTTEEEENSFPVHQTFNPEDFIDKLTSEEETENQFGNEAASVLDSYTVAQKLDRVRAVILMLNDFAGADEKTISTLRELQKHLRDQTPFEDI